uniref:Uncharacterized protein n=1 Tax=Phaseolus vulgaris TaxID=3885 RepID=I6ZTT7_PHAVU|nr:uncharacterized protein [Phaseolus vulgaris]
MDQSSLGTTKICIGTNVKVKVDCFGRNHDTCNLKEQYHVVDENKDEFEDEGLYVTQRNIGINWEYEVITSLYSSGPHSSFDPKRNRTQLCQKHNNPKSSLTFFALFAIPLFNPPLHSSPRFYKITILALEYGMFFMHF